MKSYPDKCHLLSMTQTSIKLKGYEINNTKCETLLGVTLDNKLNFNTHLDKGLTKARQKVNTLARIAPYTNIVKKKLIMNSLFISQFNCLDAS